MTHVGIGTLPRLVARTREISGGQDLLDALGDDGFAWLSGDDGFVTDGCAARVPTTEALAVLETIAHERAAGTPRRVGPRAVGALPFTASESGSLVIPAVIVLRDGDGRTWQTNIGPAPTRELRVTARTPRVVRVAPGNNGHWRGMVDKALADINGGRLEKVVLSRVVEVEADEPFDRRAALATLRREQSGCVVYADHDFLGASPELLVRRRGRSIECRPMAGTGDDPERLERSPKDAREHQVVVDAIRDILHGRGCETEATGPVVARFAHVAHLATTIRGTLRDDTSALDLALALHPTPAVGGWPTADALALIEALEPHERGRYAGPCGWLDASGDGEFIVALRCAEFEGTTARCYAGAGIVAGSDPDSEWCETEAKLRPMLRALTP